MKLQHHPFESIQNIKLLMSIMFSNNKSITFQIIQYANFSSFTFEKYAAATAAIVQLQQQYLYKPIQNVKLLIYTRFCDNKWIYINNYSICSCSCNCSCSCYAAAAGLQLQQQHPFESIQKDIAAAAAALQPHYCSCSCSCKLNNCWYKSIYYHKTWYI